MRLTYGSSILKFGVWEHGFTTRIWLEACTISQAGRFFTVNKFWLLFKCKMSIRPLCPALRLQRVLSHQLCFVCLGLPPKSDFLHPVLLQGVGSPLLSGSNFGRARGTARAPARAYLLYGYHYFIYILLFIYIYIFNRYICLLLYRYPTLTPWLSPSKYKVRTVLTAFSHLSEGQE